MVSSALSLCAALLLAAFFGVSKAQTSSYYRYINPYNDPYNASRDASCLLTPEQQAAVLEKTNEYRSMFVNTPNLTWDDGLAQRAAWWACSFNCETSACADAPYEGYGISSNAYQGGTPLDAVEAWFGEIGRYNFSDPHWGKFTGHFTQLIWRTSWYIGCAAKLCQPQLDNYFVVCQFDPAGNVLGTFPENVMPLKPEYATLSFTPYQYASGYVSVFSWAPVTSTETPVTIVPSSGALPVYSVIEYTVPGGVGSVPSTISASNGPGSTITAVPVYITSTPTYEPVYTIPFGDWSDFFPSTAQFTYLSATDSLTTTATTSTSSNSNGSTMDAINRLTITATTSTSSNSCGSTMDATDRSTITSKKSASISHGSAIDATDRSTSTSKKSTSNSNGSAMDATDKSTTTATTSASSNSHSSIMNTTDRSTATSKKSTSSNSHGSTMDATNRSTTTATISTSNIHGSTIDATDRSTITSKKSTSSNSNGSDMNTTDRSIITSKKSTSSNSNGSAMDATDRSTSTSKKSTSSNSHSSAMDATDRSAITATTSTPSNSNGSVIGASSKTHAAGEAASAKTNVAHSVTTAIVESTRMVDVTECPICSLSTATTSFSSQNGQTVLHGEPVLRVSTVYTTDGVVITTYTPSCPESAKTGSVTASTATTTAHSEVSMESAHANVVPSVSVATSASNSAESVTVAKYEGLAASLTSDVLFSAILMALIHLI